MLENIRKIAHHYLFKIFFLLIAVAFVVSLRDFSDSNVNELGKVGSKVISLQGFIQKKQEIVKQFANQGLDAEQINKIVIMRLTTQALLEQKTQDLGIIVSPEVLAEYIRNDSSFHKNGEFDLKIFKDILEQNNLSEERLLKSLSSQVASKFLVDSLSVNLPLKSILSDYLYDDLTEKRAIVLLEVDTRNVKISTIAEDELSKYYKKNNNLFQSNEKRNFSYILLSMDEYKKHIEINDAMLYADYEKNMAEYAFPENRDFYHFVAQSKEIADQLVAELKINNDIKLIAQNFVEKNVVNENFTNQSSSSFLATVDPNLFILKEGDVTEAVKTDLGWHVFKVTKIHPKKYKSFAEARLEVEMKLKQNIAEQQLYDLSKKIEDDIASGAEFEEIAKNNNLPLIKVQDASGNDPFTIVAFQTGLNEISEITRISEVTLNQDNQDYFIVKVDEIIPAKVMEYSEVKDRVRDIYSMQLRKDISYALAKDLKSYYQKEKLDLLKDSSVKKEVVASLLKASIEKYKISPEDIKISITSKEIVRPIMGNNVNIPPVYADEIFSLKLGKLSAVEALGDYNYGFSVVKNVIENKKRDPHMYKYIESVGDVNYKNEIYDQYVDSLKKQYPININFEVINNIAE